jgi:hypothetical protein
MISDYYWMLSDSPNPGPMLYRDYKDGDTAPRIRPEYENFFCPRCGKVRTDDIHREGLPVKATIRSKDALIQCADGDLLVAPDLANALQELAPDFILLKSTLNSKYCILTPRIVYEGKDFLNSFRRSTISSCCKILREEVFGAELPRVNPDPIIGFSLQHSIARDILVFVSPEIMGHLKPRKFKRVCFTPLQELFYDRSQQGRL